MADIRNIFSQIVDYYHDFVFEDTSNYRNDFIVDIIGDVEDPMGGLESITPYDTYNLDQEFNE